MAFSPLLQVIAAAGFFGGRELLERREQGREDAAARSALSTFNRGAGQVGADGFGPPLPERFGDSPLDNRQAATALAMSAGDPQAALDFAISQAARNDAMQAQAENVQYRNAGLELQRSRFGQQESRLQFDRKKFQWEQEQATAAANAAIVPGSPQDLQVRMMQGLAQRGFVPVQDAQTGQLEAVPIQGTEAYQEGSRELQARTDRLGRAVELFELMETAGRTADPGKLSTQAAQSLYGSLVIDLKNLFELGAVTGDDLALIENVMADPTNYVDQLQKGDVAALEKVARVADIFAQDAARTGYQTRNWQLNPTDTTKLGNVLQRAEGVLGRQDQYRERQLEIMQNPASGAGASFMRGLETMFLEGAGQNPLTRDASNARLAELRAEAESVRNQLGGAPLSGTAAGLGRSVAGRGGDLLQLVGRFLTRR